jgi:hypothetical protein
MQINMTDEGVFSIAQIQALLKLENGVEFEVDKSGFENRQKMYDWVSEALLKFKYYSLETRKERGCVIRYIVKITNLSKSQVKKLIKKKKDSGKISLNISNKEKFPVKYSTSDIQRLVDTDNAHDRLSGQATKRILEREYTVFGKVEFEKIRAVSVSHIYNIRNTKEQYISNSLTFKHTKAVQRDIGVRKKPITDGKPGFLRVDTVHQGDLNGAKGIYHINLVDEETQTEVLGCVEEISERFLLPLLERAIKDFPFVILNFHSDNGGEYINHRTAHLLNKLHIEQTKSRSYHSNDNGLVETKNGAIVRKHFGRTHIPRHLAKYVDKFYSDFMYEYLNFHRPCAFSSDRVSASGKIVKKYDVFLTPFEKLQTIPDWEKYLKPGTTKEQLIAYSKLQSDNECGKKMLAEKKKLMENLRKMQN